MTDRTANISLSDSSAAGAGNEGHNESLFAREWSVLGGGLSSGLARATTTTVTDLENTASSFARHPLDTAGNFLKDHWKDAAAGAAITFINPRGWTDYLLIGYAVMQGVGISTLEAASKAADPGADLARLKADYANSVSQEGADFLGSLPMTMAGGMLGRSAANAVFGKDLGVFDFLTGRVSASKVSANLIGLKGSVKDSLFPPATKLVVTDMDNTLFPFSRSYAEGMSKAVKELSGKTGLSEDALYKSLGEQMDKYHSQNYPWMVELALSKKLGVGEPGKMSYSEFTSNISDPFWSTVNDAMKKHLKPFDSVVPTLKELQAKRIPVAVLSNASAQTGIQRLTIMGLDRGLVDRFYTTDTPKPPTGLAPELVQAGQRRVDSWLSADNGLKEFRIIPRDWKKPDTRGLDALMSAYDVRPRQVLIVGDGLKNDMGLATRSGARGLLVTDKSYTTPADESVIQRFRAKPKVASPAPANLRYDGSVNKFSGLLDHLDPRFDFRRTAGSLATALLVRPEGTVIIGGYGVLDHGHASPEKKQPAS